MSRATKAFLYVVVIASGVLIGGYLKVNLGIIASYKCYTNHCFYIVVHPKWW